MLCVFRPSRWLHIHFHAHLRPAVGWGVETTRTCWTDGDVWRELTLWLGHFTLSVHTYGEEKYETHAEAAGETRSRTNSRQEDV